MTLARVEVVRAAIRGFIFGTRAVGGMSPKYSYEVQAVDRAGDAGSAVRRFRNDVLQ